MARDLKFYWQEQMQQIQDDHIQKVQESTRMALIDWTRSKGEGKDYSENKPVLRFNPPGHWYEIPNMIKNGVLSSLLKSNDQLKYLLCQNVDTLGASADPAILGMHIDSKAAITFEVTPRRFEDSGGGLAYVNGHMRLIEGLALPREEDEFRLSYYNTLTCWIDIDALLNFFGIDRDMVLHASDDSQNALQILDSLYKAECSIPTYVTLKNVKHIWGQGQEDLYPVAQFEKLWGDITGLQDLRTRYVAVPRFRGQQLKDPSLLDKWINDGSLAHVRKLCCFSSHMT